MPRFLNYASCWLGGVLLLSMSHNEGKLAYFGAIDRVRFRKPVVPGDTLITEVELLRNRGSIGKVRATGKVGDTVVAEAEFTFVLVGEGENNTQDPTGEVE